MPIDANTFNDTDIEVFFAHVNGCTMAQEAFFVIRLKGLLNPSNLEELDEEDIGNTFTNMRCPSPTVTAVVTFPFQVINAPTKSQKHLIIAYIAARYYKSIRRDLNPKKAKWKVLKEIGL